MPVPVLHGPEVNGRSVLAGWALGELGAGLTQVPGDEGTDDLGAPTVANKAAKAVP